MLFDYKRVRSASLLAIISASLILSACEEKVNSQKSAYAAIANTVKNTVKPSYRENQVRANIRLSRTDLTTLLPNLNEYPLSSTQPDSSAVEVVEIFTSSEKAGQGRDGVYIELAKAFNQQQTKLNNGKTALINIRGIPSGLGAQFMLAGRYTPDAFSPSNALWGDMLIADRIQLDSIADVTAPNTAGIVVKKAKSDLISSNDELDIPKLLTNVSNGTFAMGYTNPFQSSTGLNFLLTVLNAFAQGDESQMLSPDVASAFEAFQTGVPFVAQTTIQMREAAQGSGVLDAMVMEYQSWMNTTGMSDYQFIPFGVRHDSPLYATPEADASEREALALFADFIAQNQSLVEKYGFGENPGYKDAFHLKDSTLIAQAQKVWKEKKSGGRPIAAVFVADVSGSMEGTRLANLKQALVESSDLISPANAIGLVTYNDRVNVDLFLRDFSVQQKSLFIGTVERFSASGGTASNDGILVAANMLAEFSVQHPDHKLLIFVLSDGERNRGQSFEAVKEVLTSAGIPIHSIAYEIQSPELQQLSALVEGAYIESNVESASYRIGNLLNAEM